MKKEDKDLIVDTLRALVVQLAEREALSHEEVLTIADLINKMSIANNEE